MSVSHPAQVSPAPPAAPRPAPSRGPRSWLRRIIGGGQIIETCPEWCGDHHENDRSMRRLVDDLSHQSAPVALELELSPAGSAEKTLWPVLSAKLNVDPYSDEPGWSTPHILFEAAPEDIAECLSPEAFAGLVAQIRVHCDRLDEVVAACVRARAEYLGKA